MKLLERLRRTSEDDAWPASSRIFLGRVAKRFLREKSHRESAMQRASGSPVEAAELGTLPLFDDGGNIA